MEFGVIEGIFTVKLNLVATTTLACMLLLFGYFLRRKVKVFEKFCFPAPVIGGFIFAILALVLHVTKIMAFDLDTTLQTPFMLAFFTTVGLGGSFKLLKSGGKSLIIYLVFCWALSLIQNGLGSALAYLLGEHPLIGVMAGAVALEGGHGAALSFGPQIEGLGVSGATAVGVAAATFGLIVGSLTGGPLAQFMIEKHHVPIEAEVVESEAIEEAEQSKQSITAQETFRMMALLGVMMMIGVLLAAGVERLNLPNFVLPGYVGAMVGAMVFRNVNDHIPMVTMNFKVIDYIADISLGIFLSMAMMSLKIWELARLALPLFVILLAQAVLLILLTYFVLFRFLGKNYDAAVMCSGMMGHGLGATPNAVANMDSVCRHYHMDSPKAFLIVPLCGAVLIDIVAIPCITLFIGWLA